MFNRILKNFYSTQLRHQPSNGISSKVKKQIHQLQISIVLQPLNIGKSISANFWPLFFLIITFLEKKSFLSAYFYFYKMPKLYDTAYALERISRFYVNTSSS